LPTVDGDLVPLNAAPDQMLLEVRRVSDDRPEALRYLGERGIVPGATIEVGERSDIAGTLTVTVLGDGEPVVLGLPIATVIEVSVGVAAKA
jgi:DtxR family Mn-dependent transcriptional regulator